MSLLSTLSSDLKRKLVYAHLAIFIVLLIGTICFRYLEDLTWLESVYFTAATVTTVGYGDIVPKTSGGKIFTVFFILLGVGTFLYALSILAQALIHVEVISALGLRRKTKEMEKLTDHYIICGAGRVGRKIVYSLQTQDLPFVVIDPDIEKTKKIQLNDKQIILNADATLEKNLISAGVERAKGLAACLPEDALNVYVVLTARDMNKDLHIVSRAVEEEAEHKLLRAGANRVVAPTIIGGLNMSRSLTKPAIADFMDSIVAEHLDLVFEEILISDRSQYVGKKLFQTNFSRELNVLIVAIRRKNGEMIFNPGGESFIERGDLLIVVGKAESMQKLIEANK